MYVPAHKPSRESLFRLALTLSVATQMMIPALAANSVPLSAIDFANENGQTTIRLHTPSPVQTRNVLVSDNKVVVDIQDVISENTIKTNFIQAGNVSHVILQPVSENQLRLIIRGKNLGTPAISYPRTMSSSFASNTIAPAPKKIIENKASNWLTQEPDPAIGSATQDANALTAVPITPPDAKPAAPAQKAQPASAPAPANVLPDESANILANTEADLAPLNLHSPESTFASSKKSSPEATSLLGKQSMVQSEGAEGPHFKTLLKHIHSNPVVWWVIQGLGLVGIVSLFGLFMLKKWQSLNAIPKAPKGQDKVNFAELAKSRKEGRNTGNELIDEDEFIVDEPIAVNKKSAQTPTNKPNKQPIGLNALKQQAQPEKSKAIPDGVQKIQPPAAQKLSAMMTSAPPKPTITTAPTHQALHQYAKNQAPVVPPKYPSLGKSLKPGLSKVKPPMGKSRPVAPPQPTAQPQKAPNQKQTTLPPATPSATSKIQPFTPERIVSAPKQAAVGKSAMPAKATLDRQGNLPANPEVLDFLRSVADLMDDESRSTILRQHAADPQRT